MQVEVFPNPSKQKVPDRLKYKAVASSMGEITSARYLGIGYGSTKAIAKSRAVADYKKKHK